MLMRFIRKFREDNYLIYKGFMNAIPAYVNYLDSAGIKWASGFLDCGDGWCGNYYMYWDKVYFCNSVPLLIIMF